MKITIAAIGKGKNDPSTLLFSHFIKRLPWEITLKEVEEKKPLAPELLKQREAELLLQSIPQNTKIIALDERGKLLSSPAFTEKLSQYQDQGYHQLAFLIGGAHGHGEIIREKADLVLSLSTMTWPHMLVRAMLAEQLYRAYTIMTGHPYHKI